MYSRTAALLAAVTCCLPAAGCGGGDTTITGVVTVKMLPPDVTVDNPSEGDRCQSAAGYDDVHQGSQVTVTGPSGDTLGFGTLSAGRMHSTQPDSADPWISGRCEFTFTVTGVDGGQKFYAVHVGNDTRGQVRFTRAQIGDPVVLSLG
ncbi:MAG TPA: hypothetical protein VIS06_12655 [Mycobacteriales bacterium]